MKIYSTHSVKIKHYNHIFKDTVIVYRKAVNFLIDVCLDKWTDISALKGNLLKQQHVEQLCHMTKDNPLPQYPDFDKKFYKMPSDMRRGAINEAIGKVSSYKSNLANWNENPVGNKPSTPKAGYVFPSMYRTVMYDQTDMYTAQIKIYVRNTWDWIAVDLKKSDMDYIYRRCSTRKQCAPTLQKRGKEWFLDFPFEEKVKLATVPVNEQLIVAVDLGINSSVVCSVMDHKGTVYGRHFLRLSSEQDSLSHAIGRSKKAQQHRNYKTPRLWARAKGINHDIACKTTKFIMDVATLYNADVIVFEHLDLDGKKRGSKKQRLHMW